MIMHCEQSEVISHTVIQSSSQRGTKLSPEASCAAQYFWDVVGTTMGDCLNLSYSI